MNNQIAILTAINHMPMNESQIARRFFDGRVLKARQSIQHLIWSGVIVPSPVGYVLSEQAKYFLQVAQNRQAADLDLALAANF